MNQTADVGAGLVANPPAELQELLNDSRTTDSAREAIADITKTPASASSANGHGQSHKDSSSKLGDGRLQVVDEKQDFTFVFPLHEPRIGADLPERTYRDTSTSGACWTKVSPTMWSPFSDHNPPENQPC